MDAQTQGFIDGRMLAIGNAAKAVFEAEDKSPDEQEFLVQALIDLLLAAGDLTKDQAAEAWFEPQSREFGGFVDLFHSYSELRQACACTRVYFDGNVEHQEC